MDLPYLFCMNVNIFKKIDFNFDLKLYMLTWIVQNYLVKVYLFFFKFSNIKLKYF